MRRFLVILVLPMFFLSLMSCKSGGNTSDVEGITSQGTMYNRPYEFFPSNCDPRKGRTSYVKIFKNSSKSLPVIELPETCSFEDLRDVSKLANNPQTRTIKIKSFEDYVTGMSSTFGLGSDDLWCVYDDSKEGKAYFKNSNKQSTYNCDKYIEEQFKKGNISDTSFFSAKNAGKIFLVSPVRQFSGTTFKTIKSVKGDDFHWFIQNGEIRDTKINKIEFQFIKFEDIPEDQKSSKNTPIKFETKFHNFEIEIQK